MALGPRMTPRRCTQDLQVAMSAQDRLRASRVPCTFPIPTDSPQLQLVGDDQLGGAARSRSLSWSTKRSASPLVLVSHSFGRFVGGREKQKQ